MKRASEGKKKKKRKVSDILLTILIAALVGVCAFSLYKIITIQMSYNRLDNTNEEVVSNVFVPAETETEETEAEEEEDDGFPDYIYDSEAAAAINEDIQGILYIPSLELTLHFVQGDDNTYYLRHLTDGTYNNGGTLFIDANITGGIDASHVIIYGHNLKNKSMFSYNSNYLEESFYETEGNDVFYIYTADSIRRYTIYTAYETESTSDIYTFNFSSLERLREYAEYTKSLCAYDTGVDVSEATQIVTLSTCAVSYLTTQRIIISGVLTAEKSVS